MTNLLIVESPAKCKKIQGFLGDSWRVQATMGHIRALKEELSGIGFSAPNGYVQSWAPIYEAIAAKQPTIAALRSAARGATVYLGSDDDREGEAIAWHTCAVLGLDPATTPRVVFHEITAPALRAAVAAPRRIDMNKFNAQQARSMLDMLIGFTLSPCLWRSVAGKKGLSAGRCQTPTLRLIYDRDMEIAAHQVTNTWRLKVTTDDAIDDSTLEWTDSTIYPNADAVAPLLTEAAKGKPKVVTITDRTERVATSAPPKPFITSTLQQEASSRLSMQPKATMKTAQTLYEAGHITYMRTDNPVLSDEARVAAQAVVEGRWGAAYVKPEEAPTKANTKTKAKKAAEAQNAHEGIRPTHMDLEDPPGLVGPEKRLYDLIWKRTLQSVMASETRDVVRLGGTICAVGSLATDWERVKFAGWRILDHERKPEEEIAYESDVYDARCDLVVGTTLPWQKVVSTEQRSTPAPRYTEAALIRELESRGIGRPSTYATLVETVLDRGYVEKATIPAAPVTLGVLTLTAKAATPKRTERTEKAGGEKDKLRTTELGRTIMTWLLEHFGDMVDYDVTAAMEAQLDEVSKGERLWPSVLTESWERYADRYAAIMSSPSTGGGGGGNTVDLGDGYKVVNSRKGLLFVLEQEGQKTRFAEVPSDLTLQTASREDAEAAFAGTLIGHMDDGQAVYRRKGRYGFYATCGSVRVNCSEDDTVETLLPKLRPGGVAAVDHVVGPYKIKLGPYGLYMFKMGSVGKPVFISIPADTPYTTLTVEGAEELYKSSAKGVTKKGTASTKGRKKKTEAQG